MSHQIYFVHTELDVPAFLNLVYGKGGVILCEKGLLWDKEQALEILTQAMVYRQKLSIFDAGTIDEPNAAVISLTLPTVFSWEPRIYQAGRMYFPPDSAGVYDPACLKLFRRIKNGITKNYHYLPSDGHYLSDRLLQGCRENKWSAVYYHGTPIPIPERTADGVEGKGEIR